MAYFPWVTGTALSAQSSIAFKESSAVDAGYLITVLAITIVLLVAAGLALGFVKKKGLIKAIKHTRGTDSVYVISSTRISTRTTAIMLEADGKRLLVLEHPSSLSIVEYPYDKPLTDQK